MGALVGYQIVTQKYRDQAETYDVSLVNVLGLPNLIYDREDREIGRLFVENRSPVGIEEIPQKMIDALVSGEDSRFFEHNGVDFMGIGRAIYLNFKSGDNDSGASTLTMQLARNAYNLKDEAIDRGASVYERKLVEIYLAQRIEKNYTKLKILEFYLNRVAFGNGYFGVRSAALGYFGKEPKDLAVEECASLVGCIKNPSIFSPVKSLKRNKKARDHVLNRMQIEGRISASERDRLIAQDVVLNPKPIQRNTSHLYDRIAEVVKEHVPSEELDRGGFRVFTAVDLDIQKSLEVKLRKQLAEAETHPEYKHTKYRDYRRKGKSAPKYLQGAALMVDHRNGEVLGYVGGRDFSDSQYDFIQSGSKPLGTGFFPVIYSAALEHGMHLSSPLLDEAMDNRQVMIDGEEGILGEWGHEVMTPRYEGDILLRQGLAKSKIAATVRLGRKIGLAKIREMAKRFGFTVPTSKVLTRELLGTESVSLIELVRAFSVFGNQGSAPMSMVWVTRIENAQGEVIYQSPTTVKQRAVLHPATAYLGHSMFKSALEEGSGARGFESDLFKHDDVGGKSGTTSDFADNWFVGYNSQVTCAVWAGFWDGSREAIYPAAFSVDTVMPVWLSAMTKHVKKYQPGRIEKPTEIQAMRVCRVSGLRVTTDCEEYERDEKSGKMQAVSTGFEELYYTHSKPLGYCDKHGSGMRSIDASLFALSRRVTARGAKGVSPVKPMAPTLLGEDPYSSEQPAFVPLDASDDDDEERGLDAVNPDLLVRQDREASIVISKPGRMVIISD